MIKIEYIKRLGWLAAGVALAAIALPTAAVAAGITFTGIEGANAHKADVTSAGQLLATQASPGSFFSSVQQVITATTAAQISLAAPAKGKALVVTSIHAAVIQLLGQQNDGTGVGYYIAENNPSANLNCTNSFVSSVDEVRPAATGTTVLPYDPGVAIPAGDQLCEVVGAGNTGDEINVASYTFGYSVPSKDVPAAPARHLTKRQIRQMVLPKPA